MSEHTGTLPDWVSAVITGIVMLGSISGVYAALNTDIAVNKVEIKEVKYNQEATTRAIEKLTNSTERLTISVVRLEERIRRGFE